MPSYLWEFVWENFITVIVFVCRDHQKKQSTLTALKRKALDKNPDEFYFKMVRTGLKVTLLVLGKFSSQQSVVKDTSLSTLAVFTETA